MPASRKRNKGKERKAKKAKNARSMMHTIWSSMLASACDHGCAAIPVIGHPVSNFMNDYYMPLILEDSVVSGTGLVKSFRTCPEVWKDDSYREMLVDVLIGIGTNMLLFDVNESGPNFKALRVASVILILEEYGKTKDINLALIGRDTSSKRRILAPGVSSNERDVLKFYRKRVSCKCLKRMHLDAKKIIPKMGKCFNCNDERERVNLSFCSRCMISQYCSRECQVAHWPEHEELCDYASQVHHQSDCISGAIKSIQHRIKHHHRR